MKNATQKLLIVSNRKERLDLPLQNEGPTPNSWSIQSFTEVINTLLVLPGTKIYEQREMLMANLIKNIIAW